MSRHEERLGNYSIHSSAHEAGSPSRVFIAVHMKLGLPLGYS